MVVGHYRMEEIISFFRNLWHSSWTGLKAKTRRAEEQSNDQVGSRWTTCGGEGGEIFAIGSTIIIVIVTTTTTTTSYFCCLARVPSPRFMWRFHIGRFSSSFFLLLSLLSTMHRKWSACLVWGSARSETVAENLRAGFDAPHTKVHRPSRWPLAATATGWGSRTTAYRFGWLLGSIIGGDETKPSL